MSGDEMRDTAATVAPGDVWTAVHEALVEERDKHPRLPDDADSAALADAVFEAIYRAGYVCTPIKTETGN